MTVQNKYSADPLIKARKILLLYLDISEIILYNKSKYKSCDEDSSRREMAQRVGVGVSRCRLPTREYHFRAVRGKEYEYRATPALRNTGAY